MPHLVARIGKPHALRGEVTVQLHTDAPGERFVPGAVLATEPPERGPLTVRSVRVHQGVHLLGFEEATDRTAAEALRGTRLFVDEADDAGSDDGWYAEELEGLEVRDAHGEVLGRVTGLLTRPVQDLLEIELTDGREALLPFVEELVPEVDPGAGYLVAVPPPGLFDLDDASGERPEGQGDDTAPGAGVTA